MIRTGPKGTDEFRRASWDEALDLIEENIKKTIDEYGAKSLMSHYGRGAFEQMTNDLLGRENPNAKTIPKFFEPLGSPNNASVGSLCYTAFGVFAPVTTLGIYGGGIMPDFENADLIYIWGTNPDTNSPPNVTSRLLKQKARGAKLVCIDHYNTSFAKKCDEVHLIRSGTDGILALGIIKTLIERELYDKEFVENWCHGFEELSNYVNKIEYNTIEKHTGIKKEAVIDLAEQLASIKRSSLLTYTGIEYSNSGVQTIRSVYLIWALLGYLDVEGTLLLSANPSLQYSDIKPSDPLPIGAEEFPVFNHLLQTAQFMRFPKAVLEEKPYPIKFLLNLGSSILTSYPSTELYRKALNGLDFFVNVDRYLTEDSLYADVVLPASTYFEIDSYKVTPSSIMAKPRAIKPYYESKGDTEILHLIAARFGYGERYPVTLEEIADSLFDDKDDKKEFLKGSKVERKVPERIYKKHESSLLRADGKPGFPTPTGKIEIHSTILERFGYDPLPVYKKPAFNIFSEDSPKEYPLTMNTGARIASKFRSQFLNNSTLLKYHIRPLVSINPKDASARGIIDGDPILLKTQFGEVEFWAKVTEDLPQSEVEVQMGGGSIAQDIHWRKADLNRIISADNYDEISGFPIFKALICEVELDESRSNYLVENNQEIKKIV